MTMTSHPSTPHYCLFTHAPTTEIYTLSLHDALPISFGNYMGASNTNVTRRAVGQQLSGSATAIRATTLSCTGRSEEHTSELQSLRHLVCRLLLEKKNI